MAEGRVIENLLTSLTKSSLTDQSNLPLTVGFVLIWTCLSLSKHLLYSKFHHLLKDTLTDLEVESKYPSAQEEHVQFSGPVNVWTCGPVDL